MSSLWTPSGEHRIPSSQQDDAPPTGDAGGQGSGRPGPGRPGPRGAPEGGPATAERAQMEAQMEEVRRQLVEAPASAVVANHCYGLFELGALHLSQPEPDLEAARLAIDAMAALLDGLSGRLGDAEPEMREGLAQIRLAFVQVQAAATAGPSGT